MSKELELKESLVEDILDVINTPVREDDDLRSHLERVMDRTFARSIKKKERENEEESIWRDSGKSWR